MADKNDRANYSHSIITIVDDNKNEHHYNNAASDAECSIVDIMPKDQFPTPVAGKEQFPAPGTGKEQFLAPVDDKPVAEPLSENSSTTKTSSNSASTPRQQQQQQQFKQDRDPNQDYQQRTSHDSRLLSNNSQHQNPLSMSINYNNNSRFPQSMAADCPDMDVIRCDRSKSDHNNDARSLDRSTSVHEDGPNFPLNPMPANAVPTATADMSSPGYVGSRRTSRVWLYFRMVDQYHYACQLCNFVGAYTNTTNMRKHIQHHHPERYQDLLDHTRPSNRPNIQYYPSVAPQHGHPETNEFPHMQDQQHPQYTLPRMQSISIAERGNYVYPNNINNYSLQSRQGAFSMSSASPVTFEPTSGFSVNTNVNNANFIPGHHSSVAATSTSRAIGGSQYPYNNFNNRNTSPNSRVGSKNSMVCEPYGPVMDHALKRATAARVSVVSTCAASRRVPAIKPERRRTLNDACGSNDTDNKSSTNLAETRRPISADRAKFDSDEYGDVSAESSRSPLEVKPILSGMRVGDAQFYDLLTDSCADRNSTVPANRGTNKQKI